MSKKTRRRLTRHHDSGSSAPRQASKAKDQAPDESRTGIIEGLEAKSQGRHASSLLLCCLPGMDNFVDDLIRALAPQITVEKLVTGQAQLFIEAIQRYRTVWLEWGNQAAEWLTQQAAGLLKSRRVICRIHSYEVLDGIADKLNFSVIDDLIFVAPHIRDYLLARRPELRGLVKRIHVIPNGVDLERFPLQNKGPGRNIAYLGQINFKKDPMVLMHAFQKAHARDKSLRLHIGGDFGQSRFPQAMAHFVQSNKLKDAVQFYGRINDVEAWLKDKHYVICSSLMEGHPVGLLEAMATGCRPLIYNWPGAEVFYPIDFIWNNIEELQERIGQPISSKACRDFVANNYSLEIQTESLRRLILQEEQINFSIYRPLSYQKPEMSELCFSTNRHDRSNANKQVGLTLLNNHDDGYLESAAIALERAFEQSHNRDLEAANHLITLYRNMARWEDLGDVYRRIGLRAALDKNYQNMLSAFYLCKYAAYMCTRQYTWMKYDPAIETVMQLVAPKIEPRVGYQEIVAQVDRSKIKVAFGIEGFDINQAPIREILSIARKLNKERFEVIFVTRLNLESAWRPIVEELLSEGCYIVAEPGNDELDKLRKALYCLKNVGCQVLILQSPWLVPWLDLLGMCRPAAYIIKFLTQMGGKEKHMDYIFAIDDHLLVDEVLDGIFLGQSYAPLAERRQAPRPRQSGQLKVICAGRAVKFENGRFWSALEHAVEAVPGLEIEVAGLQQSELLPNLHNPHERIKFLGFKSDLPAMLKNYDILIDTWPIGGGSTIREAFAAGIPTISYKIDLSQSMDVTTGRISAFNQLIHPELLLSNMDAHSLTLVLKRLAEDDQYMDRIIRDLSDMPVLTFDEYVARFEDFLLKLVSEEQHKC